MSQDERREVKMEALRGAWRAPVLVKGDWLNRARWGFPRGAGFRCDGSPRSCQAGVTCPREPRSVHRHLNESSKPLLGYCMRADHRPRCDTTIKHNAGTSCGYSPQAHTYLALLYTKLALQCAGAGRHGRLDWIVGCSVTTRAPTGEVMAPECRLCCWLPSGAWRDSMVQGEELSRPLSWRARSGPEMADLGPANYRV